MRRGRFSKAQGQGQFSTFSLSLETALSSKLQALYCFIWGEWGEEWIRRYEKELSQLYREKKKKFEGNKDFQLYDS